MRPVLISCGNPKALPLLRTIWNPWEVVGLVLRTCERDSTLVDLLRLPVRRALILRDYDGDVRDLLVAGLLGDVWECPECGDGTENHLAEWETSGGARPLRGRSGWDRYCPLCEGRVLIDRRGLGVSLMMVEGQKPDGIQQAHRDTGIPVVCGGEVMGEIPDDLRELVGRKWLGGQNA